MFQVLDLGAPGIMLQQFIQPFQLHHDPRWVYPWRRECGWLLDGRPFSPAALTRCLDRSQFACGQTAGPLPEARECLGKLAVCR
jgi:hypothetical protein